MISMYTYDLKKGNKIIGFVTFSYPLHGKYVVISEVSKCKNKYIKTHRFPIKIELAHDDGVDIIYTRVINVSKKSKRQIELLTNGGAYFI